MLRAVPMNMPSGKGNRNSLWMKLRSVRAKH